MSSYLSQWPAAWTDKRFRIALGTAVGSLALALFTLPGFLTWVERRPGVVLPDPVLDRIPVVDLTWLIFSLVYAGLIGAVVSLIPRPRQLVLALHAYALLVWFRMGAMYLVPLEPPGGTVPLRDPFVQLFGTGNVLMKDLFFSGHTATLFILCLTAWHPVVRKLFLAATIGVAIAVIVHHTHYTIDVYVAPFFAYASYRIAIALNERIYFRTT